MPERDRPLEDYVREAKRLRDRAVAEFFTALWALPRKWIAAGLGRPHGDGLNTARRPDAG